jgi:hypothetical protein
MQYETEYLAYFKLDLSKESPDPMGSLVNKEDRLINGNQTSYGKTRKNAVDGRQGEAVCESTD